MILPTIYVENFTLNNNKFSFTFVKNFLYNYSSNLGEIQKEITLNNDTEFFDNFNRKNEMIQDMLVLRILEKNQPTLKVVIDKYLIENITKQWWHNGFVTMFVIEGFLSSRGMSCYMDSSMDFVLNSL